MSLSSGQKDALTGQIPSPSLGARADRVSARLSLPRLTPIRCVVALNAAAVLALIAHFAMYLAYALDAVRFPFELDYGEGIVWQQAVLIPGAKMYGDIAQYPFLVFHYPPVYHLAVRALSSLGGDMLLTGRALSLFCTLLLGVLAAALVRDIVGRRVTRAARWIGAVAGGLTVFCYFPVLVWSPLMRVDMLAMLFAFLGLWLALHPARRPWMLPCAVLSFVLAVYAKQSQIAAPLAVLAVFWVADRRRAIHAFGLSLAVGSIALAALSWMTDGGFLRHLLLYNLNRFTLNAAVTTILEQSQQFVFLVLALYGMAAGWKWVEGPADWKSLTRRLRDPDDRGPARAMAVLTVYLVLATAMLVTLGKSGATINYLIEWMCLWSVPIGILVARTLDPFLTEPPAILRDKTVFALLVPGVLVVQVLIMPARHDYGTDIPERTRQLGLLEARIRAADRPVLSDDMVLPMKAGKPVPWEPAIFAELANTGRWNEQAIVDMIRARAFAFAIVQGARGEKIHDSRITPAVEQAIREAYPRTERLAGRVLHLPPD